MKNKNLKIIYTLLMIAGIITIIKILNTSNTNILSKNSKEISSENTDIEAYGEEEIKFNDEVQGLDETVGNIDLFQYNTERTCTNEEKAIQEVATAYYNKGINAQYCSYRKSFIYSPEEATTQHTIYSVCSDYTYSVYFQAFGIQIPDITGKIIEYGKKYYDINNIKTNDVIEYWKKTTDNDGNIVYTDNKGNIKNIDLSTVSGRKQYANKLLAEYNLQIGDILCYHNGTSGHALLVYDIIYDNNGTPIDALIRESTSKYETKTTKITKGLSYAAIPNKITGITEGTFQERYLFNAYNRSDTSKRNSFIFDLKNMTYCTILRPLLKDEEGNYTGKYYDTEFSSNSNSETGYTDKGRKIKNYEIKETTLNRIQYSSIDIEKTVNVFNNTVVNLEDTLEYTIRISNKGKKTYENLVVTENIPEYVEVVNSVNGTIENQKINWKISKLAPGEKVEIKYSTKVKNDVTYLGKQIISTGTVGGIPSSTVKNMISNNLDNSQKQIIKDKTQNIINSKNYSGQELISKIYNESLGVNLGLEELQFEKLIITRDGIQYYPEGNKNKPTVYMDKENKFSNWVLSNYYGALYTNESNTVMIKFWENSSSKVSGRTEIADTIYSNSFETGDILIYQNKQIASDNVVYETEDGTYYLIYIDEKDKITIDGKETYGFIGIDQNGKLKNIENNFTDLQTLLGKDFYVIFRPSMVMPQRIELNADTNTVEVGKTLELKKQIYPETSELATKITYTSSNPNIAIVDETGKVKAKNKGTCTIKATTENGKIATYNIETTLTKEQQAIIDVANAFYYRGTAMQYDDYSMTYQTSNSKKRRSKYTHTPEEATIQDIQYSVCSEFICNVFYEAFTNGEGKNYEIKGGNNETVWFTYNLVQLADKKSKYYNQAVAIDYIENPSNNVEENKEKIINDILPGDIIIYRSSEGWGHAYLYLGNDIIINASSRSGEIVGGTYNYKEKQDKYDPKGAISIISLNNDVLNPQNKTRYILENKINKIAIIRPLNEISSNPSQSSDYRLSEKTLIRMKHNKLIRTKTASVEKYESVNLEDEITYSITIENKSDIENYSGIQISDTIPKSTEFIKLTGNGTNENGKLIWNIDIPAQKQVTVSYTVKIIKDKSILGTEIINDSTVADGIKLNTIRTKVNNTFNKKQQENLSETVLKEIGNDFASVEDLINKIYTQFKFPTPENLLNILFSTSKITIGTADTNSNAVMQTGDEGEKDIFILKNENKLSDNNKTLSNMYVKGLFGGLYTITENEPTQDDGRNKTYTSNTFTIGDILFIYDDDYKKDTYVAGEKNMYIYIGNNTFATVQNGKAMLIDGNNGAKLIDSLIGQNCFIVLRPSYSMKKIIDKIELTKKPIKLNYIQNFEELDLTGAELTVTYNDGSTEQIDLENEDIEVKGFDNSNLGKNTITIEYKEKTVTFDIEIISKQVGKIEITKKPTKINYIQNYEKLDLTGGELTVTYNDGTTDKISLKNENVKVTGFDNSKLGKNTITIGYEEKTVTFDIEIVEKQISKIEITKRPTKTNYTQNSEKLDLTGGELTIAYNDESTEKISMENENIKATGFDNSKLGKNTITVEYKGKTTTFDIEIITKKEEKPENQENKPQNTISNTVKPEIDTTISKNKFPNTGIKLWTILIISGIFIITILLKIKLKDYKDVK